MTKELAQAIATRLNDHNLLVSENDFDGEEAAVEIIWDVLKEQKSSSIELMHTAKIGSVSVSGRGEADAKKRLGDYLHTAAGREQFVEGLPPDEAETKYQEALFQFYEEGTL